MKRMMLFFSFVNGIIALLAPLVIWGQTYTNIQITTNTNDQSETSIAIDPLNSQRLMATWNSLSGSTALPPGYSFSMDGGLTWSTPSSVLPSGYSFGYDPSCAFDRSGNAFYCYIASTGSLSAVYVSKTTNLGASWTHIHKSTRAVLVTISPGSPLTKRVERVTDMFTPLGQRSKTPRITGFTATNLPIRQMAALVLPCQAPILLTK